MTRSGVRDLLRLNRVLALATLVTGAVQLAAGNVAGNRPLTAITVVILAGAVLALDRFPWPAFLTGFTAMLVSGHLGVDQDNFIAEVIAGLALVVAIAYLRRPRESLLALVYGYTALLLSSPPPAEHPRPANLAWMAILTGGAWAAGWALRARRLMIEELRSTSDELRRSREELVERAVDAERLRIAQDLHDVVAHSVTVTLVQATAADRALATRPGRRPRGDGARSRRRPARRSASSVMCSACCAPPHPPPRPRPHSPASAGSPNC